MMLATIVTRPKDWSPLERAIPPQTIPTSPPRGNMASPRPARSRPATDQGRPAGVVSASAIGRRRQLGPDLVEVGLAIALDVLGRLQQQHLLGPGPEVELVQQLLDLVAGVEGGRDQLVRQGPAHAEAGLLGQVGPVGDLVHRAGRELAAEPVDHVLEPRRRGLGRQRQELRLTAHRLVMVPAPDVQRRVERPHLELHARSLRRPSRQRQPPLRRGSAWGWFGGRRPGEPRTEPRGARWPTAAAGTGIASPTHGVGGRRTGPGRPGRSGSTSTSATRSRPSAGSGRPACSAPTAAAWTSAWPGAASSGSGAGPATASTSAVSGPRASTAGRPTGPPTACSAPWSARGASWSRPAGTRPWTGSWSGRGPSWRPRAAAPSASTPRASCSARSTTPWGSSGRAGSAPRTWTATPACARPPPARPSRRASAATASPPPTPTSTPPTPSSWSATTSPPPRRCCGRGCWTAAAGRTRRSWWWSTRGRPRPPARPDRKST